jgi:hypothetical protein
LSGSGDKNSTAAQERMRHNAQTSIKPSRQVTGASSCQILAHLEHQNMINTSRAWTAIDCRSWLFAASAALLLSACGAGDGGADNRQAASTGNSQSAPILATGTTTRRPASTSR